MTRVFIAGSITIKVLDLRVKERIDKIIDSEFDVLVGDADGVDAAVQRYLLDNNYPGVTVYCSGQTPRNNLGSWSTQSVKSTAKPGTRAFFTAKDLEMAKTADFGLMIWDAKSTGTLSNVAELLSRGRKTVVFLDRDKSFRNVGTVDQFVELTESMTDSAFKTANAKMNLSARIETLRAKQQPMFD